MVGRVSGWRESSPARADSTVHVSSGAILKYLFAGGLVVGGSGISEFVTGLGFIDLDCLVCRDHACGLLLTPKFNQSN